MSDIAILVDELNVRIVMEDVVVGFKTEPYMFCIFMEVECKIEAGGTVDPLRRRV
jgi:hypothetical protein